MRKAFSIILAIFCLTVVSVIAQVADRGKANYKSLTGASVEADLKSSSNFRAKVLDLDAADIENQARLIRLQFDGSKGIIRLQDT